MSRIPTVAVVGVEDGPEAGPGPAILACLAPSAARRVAIATSPFEAGALRADRVDRAVCVEPPELDEDAFRRGLLEAVEAEGIDVVVPGSPRVVGPLIRSRALLAGLGATVPLARSATADALERCGIHDACHRWGVATVTAWELGAAGDSSPATHEIGFPVMVTSSAAWRRRARDAAELSSIRNELRDLGVARITAVAEAAAQTFEWAGIVARGGTVRARAAVRVLMDDDRGRPWIAITIRHTDLDATAERLVAALDL